MEENKLISIIIPVYNAEKYIEKCLASVLNQTYKNIELHVIDDGSTDNSGAICDRIAKDDNRITVYHIPNSGPSIARNTGLDHVNGAYITFIDADDFVSERYIEILYKGCIESQAEIAVCDFIRAGAFYNFQEGKRMSQCVTGREAVMLQFTGYAENMVICCAKLYKSTLWETLRFPEGRQNEDISISFLVQYAAKKIILVHQILYVYYQSENSIMRCEFSKKHLDVLKAYWERYEFFKSCDQKLADMSLRSYYNRLVRAYCITKRRIPDSEQIYEELNMKIKSTYCQLRHIKQYEDLNNKKYILMKLKLWIGRYFRAFYRLLFVSNENYI